MSLREFTMRPHSNYGGTGPLVIAILAVGAVAWYLIWGPGPTRSAEETEPTVTETQTTDAVETQSTQHIFNENMTFERVYSTSNASAIIALQTEANGEYQIKECISGEILSKGILQYDNTAEKLTLTHIGTYPMSNVFAVEEQEDGTLKLSFILSESTNLKYELLGDGDTFVQKSTHGNNNIDKTTAPEQEKDGM